MCDLMSTIQAERVASCFAATSSGGSSGGCYPLLSFDRPLTTAALRSARLRPTNRTLVLQSRKALHTAKWGRTELCMKDRCFTVMAINGRRRTEIRRRAPNHPPKEANQPLGPGGFSDSEEFDVDLEYLAGGRGAGAGPVRTGPVRTKELLENQDGWILRSNYAKYLLGGMFIMGIAAGIALDSVINIEPNNVASREVIDRQTPNPNICLANGMSALVLDQRLFVSFNP